MTGLGGKPRYALGKMRFFQQDTEGDMGVTKNELPVLTEIHARGFDIVVTRLNQATDSWCVELHVSVQENSRVYQIETVRGPVKVWRQLEAAIQFAKENCPNYRTFSIRIDDLVFVKTETPE